MARVLIVDDDPGIREVLRIALRRDGFGVEEAANGLEVVRAVAAHPPDAVVLDILMPEMDGTEACRAIRKTSSVPIVFLSSKDDEIDRVLGVEMGGDDYVTKPFSPRELLARINAVLRRSSVAGAGDTLEADGLVLDPASHRVTADGQTVSLGPTEYRLLSFFMEHPERVYSRSQVLDRVWGGNVYVEERTVDVHIRRLRKALEPFQRESVVQTVRGAGYRFSTQPE